MNQLPIKYENIQASGGNHPSLHLFIMNLLTRTVTPFARIRGLDVISRLFNNSFNGKNVYTEVSLNSSTMFCYPTYDSYWSYFIHRNLLYETSLILFLHKISPFNFCFIDCGANYGYWSAIMSSREFGSHKCIAIEASPESCKVLERTASLNKGRFQCIQKAVFSRSNVKMHFSEGGRHAGRHIIDGSIEKMKVNEPGLFVPAEQVCEIQTITIDDIVDTYFPEHDSFVIKLDVEGAEIESLKGSEKVLNKNCIIIYEDFGGDEKSEVTEYLLKNNFIIYYPDEFGRLTHIIETAQLNAIKTDKRSGYNFLALNKNGFLAEKMQQMSR